MLLLWLQFGTIDPSQEHYLFVQQQQQEHQPKMVHREIKSSAKSGNKLGHTKRGKLLFLLLLVCMHVCVCVSQHSAIVNFEFITSQQDGTPTNSQHIPFIRIAAICDSLGSSTAAREPTKAKGWVAAAIHSSELCVRWLNLSVGCYG